jgi:hypothetical protein
MSARVTSKTRQPLFWERIVKSIVSLFTVLVSTIDWLLPPNMRSSRRRKVGKMRRDASPTSGLDDVARGKRAQMLIQGLIERTPADPDAGTSPPVLVQLKRVNDQPTVVLYSPSAPYQAQLFKEIEKSKDISIHDSGLRLSTLEELQRDISLEHRVEDLESRSSSELTGVESEPGWLTTITPEERRSELPTDIRESEWPGASSRGFPH